MHYFRKYLQLICDWKKKLLKKIAFVDSNRSVLIAFNLRRQVAHLA